MVVRLLVTNSKANVKKVVLRQDTVIGRSSECKLRIASQEVSRRHCSILVGENGVQIRDLGSANGTFVDGERIAPNVDLPLRTGCQLEVGNVRFLVEHDAPPPPDEPVSTSEVANAELARHVAARETIPAGNREEPGSGGEREERHPAAEPPAQPETIRNSIEDTIQELAPEEEVDVPSEFATADSTIDEFRLPDDSDVTADGEEESTGTLELPPEELPPHADVPADVLPNDEQSKISDVPPMQDPPVDRNEDEEDAADTENRETENPAKPAKKPGGWKSMFGLFGGKPKEQAAEGTSEAVAGLDDTIQMDPEDYGESSTGEDTIAEIPPERPPVQDLDETLHEPIPPSSEADPNAGDPATDLDLQVPESADEAAETSDDNLQDFFKELSNE
jgi:pSer/pThr/pTyr-binding forkhead associated (FHA) protein